MSSGCTVPPHSVDWFTIVNVSLAGGFVSSAQEHELPLSTDFAVRLLAAIGDAPHAVVSKRARISVGALNKYLNGSEPGAFKAVRLADALDVDLRWLLTGDGQANAAAGGYVAVPIYDVRLAAGAASFSDGAEQLGVMPFDKGLLRDLGRMDGQGLGVFIAEGDSMFPKIVDGARVLVDLNMTRLKEGIFAFRTGDELRIKRLRRLVDGIEIRSDNEIYPPELLTGDAADELAIIGRAIWTGTVT